MKYAQATTAAVPRRHKASGSSCECARRVSRWQSPSEIEARKGFIASSLRRRPICNAPPSLHFYTEEHVPLRAEVPHSEDFPPHKRYGQYRRGFARLVQVLKLLFKDAHWVDNLCQCERSPLNPPGNQRFRILRLGG